MPDIEKLRLTDEEIWEAYNRGDLPPAQIWIVKDLVDAQLARALWGLRDSFCCFQPDSLFGEAKQPGEPMLRWQLGKRLLDVLESAGMPQPETKVNVPQ